MPEPKMRLPAYLWCVAGAPRSTPTRDGVVEQDEVDGHLERRDRDVVLGVEMGVVLDRHVADVAVAVDADRAEVGLAVAPEVVQQRERRRRGLRHRVDEVEARALVREDVGDEQALVDLEPGLVLLQQLALGGDRGAAREVLRKALGSRVDELGDARPCAEAVRELAVDRLDVAAEVLRPTHGRPPSRARVTPPPAAGRRSRAGACRPRSGEASRARRRRPPSSSRCCP